MKWLRADLHLHTALSPCASDAMTPREIAGAAEREGLDVIAVCDHNSCANVLAVRAAAGGSLKVLAGIEITTREEVHVLGIFPRMADATSVAGEIARRLPMRADRDLAFGRQILFDGEGGISGEEPRMLSAPCAWDLTWTVRAIRDRGGLAIAAHVNRPSFSVQGRLGFFPREPRFDALEFDPDIPVPGKLPLDQLPPLPRVYSSDAHCPEMIGRCATLLRCRRADFASIAEAILVPEGRCRLA